MNKIKAVITAGIMALTSAAALCASAAENTDNDLPEDLYTYEAYCEFKPIETEGVVNMPDGSVYVDTSKMGEDGITIPVEMYMYDKYTCAGGILIKVLEPQYKLDITNPRGPYEEYGTAPYKGYDSVNSISANSYAIPNTDKFMLNAMYFDYSVTPMKLTGEHSWDVPVFMYDIEIKDTTPCGSFYVFAPDDAMVWKVLNEFIIPGIIYRYANAPGYFRPQSDLYNVTEPLHVQVSDRALGDINDDGVVDIMDGEYIESMYSVKSANSAVNWVEDGKLAAADVNGDGAVDTDDVEIVMDYALSTKDNSSSESFYEYLNETIEKQSKKNADRK